MERPYKNVTASDKIVFFVGNEIEHTPAYGMKTMFVVGTHTHDEVFQQLLKAERILNCEINHLYFGANHSFVDNDLDVWDEMITPFLDKDKWVTLDYDSRYHDAVIAQQWNKYDRFISMISVKLPNIAELNYNACLKLDDADFRHSNEGVWVHQVHDLKDRSRFTNWSQYTNDDVIKGKP